MIHDSVVSEFWGSLLDIKSEFAITRLKSTFQTTQHLVCGDTDIELSISCHRTIHKVKTAYHSQNINH